MSQVTADELRTTACEAVAHSMPPRMLEVVATASVTWPTPDRVADVAFVLETRMANRADIDRTLPWWEASGGPVSGALMDVTGIDEALATHIIGAVLQARILAGQDLVSDLVLRWGERAATWIDGRESSQEEGR